MNLPTPKKQAPDFEAWRDVANYIGRYQISNQGRVRYKKYGSGDWCEMALIERNGYLRVSLCEPYNGVKKVERSFAVHRLVLEAFVGPAPHNHFGAHLNGVRSDNRLENLKWCTRTENEAHKKMHGTYHNNKGLKFKKAVLTKELADEIVRLRDETNLPNNRIAEIVGVNTTTVNSLLGRRAYKDYWAQREGRKL